MRCRLATDATEPYHRLLLRHATRDPARIAIHAGSRVVRLGELAAEAGRLAAGLGRAGVRGGDRLAIQLPTGVEALVAFLAGSMAGAAVVPISPAYRERETGAILRDSGASLVITGLAQWPTIRAVWPEIPELRAAVLVDGSGQPGSATATPESSPLPGRAVIPLATLLGDPGETPPPPGEAGGSDLALLPYSSGTTGLPKGVMLTHGNLIATVGQFSTALDVGGDDVLLTFLPVAHIYGLMVCGVGLAAGAALVVVERFDLEQVLAAVERHRATVLFAVPPVVAALADHAGLHDHDLSSLRLINTGGAPQPVDVIRRAARRAGVPVITGYGLTEAAPVAHSPVPPRARRAGEAERWSTTRAGGVGYPVAGTALRVVDVETGCDLVPGQAGELLVRGPQVMGGYWRRLDETAAVLRDGWLRTGDLATVDPDGYITIVGRLKEIIKVKGFSVAPAELEAALLEHPAVADCAVVGRPHPRHGEVPVGLVVLRASASASVEELLDFAGARLASHKRLDAIHLVPAIPRSPAGKIIRPAVDGLLAGVRSARRG